MSATTSGIAMERDFYKLLNEFIQVAEGRGESEAIRYMDLLRREEEIGKLSEEGLASKKESFEKMVKEFWGNYGIMIIFTTNHQPGSQLIRHFKPVKIASHEYTQSKEASALQPVNHFAKNADSISVCGDNLQDRPLVKSTDRPNLSVPLTVRLEAVPDVRRLTLEQQYRISWGLHRQLQGEYPNLRCAKVEAEKYEVLAKRLCQLWSVENIQGPAFQFDKQESFDQQTGLTARARRIFWLSMNQIRESHGRDGVSLNNQVHHHIAKKLVELLVFLGADPREILIISMYAGQKRLMASKGTSLIEPKAKVRTVDAAMEREAPIILAEYVSAGKPSSFLTDPWRNNFTRPRAIELFFPIAEPESVLDCMRYNGKSAKTAFRNSFFDTFSEDVPRIAVTDGPSLWNAKCINNKPQDGSARQTPFFICRRYS